MRRSLETEETAPLLNAPVVVAEEARVRELYAAETLPARQTQTLAELQAAQTSLAATPEALALAQKREQIRRRGRAIETALNGDGGPYQQFTHVFETLGIALASGITETDALHAATCNATPQMQALFADISARITQGATLTQALQQHEEHLPDIVIPIFEHGTLYGTPENAARQTAHALRQLARVEAKFLYSALNPGVWIPLVAGGVLIVGAAPLFFALSNPLAPYTLFSAVCLGISAWGWKKRHKLAYRKIGGRNTYSAKLRGWGKGYVRRQMGGARWSRTFAALWHCGVPIGSALEAAGRSANNAYYERVLCRAAQATRNGVSLGDSLAHVGLLQGEMLENIRTGEITGDLGPALEKWADVLEDDARQRGGQVLFLWTFGLLFAVALALCILCLILSAAVFAASAQIMRHKFG